MKKILWILFLFSFFKANAQKKWSLEECIAYASAHNLTVLQNDITVKIQEKNLQGTKYQRLPNLNGTMGNNLTLGATKNDNGTIDGNQSYNNNWNLNSSITVYNGGLLRKNIEKADLDLQQTQYNSLSIINDNSISIVNNYLSILLNKELLGVAKSQLMISQNQVKTDKIRHQAGAIALGALYESESKQATELKNVEVAKVNVEQATFNLAQLLQLDDYRKFEVKNVTFPDVISPEIYNLEEITNYAYAQQPSIKSADIGMKIAEKEIEIAKTAFKPVVTASYSLGTSYSHLINNQLIKSNLLQDKPLGNQWIDNYAQVIGLNVNVPIFNRYQNKINVEKATINKELIDNQLSQKKQKIKQEIQAAYFNVTSTYQSYKASIEAVRAAKLSFEYAEKSQKAGLITIYDFNNSRNTLYAAQSSMIQAKYNYIFRQKILEFYAGKPLKF